jgi:hypothetical protein
MLTGVKLDLLKDIIPLTHQNTTVIPTNRLEPAKIAYRLKQIDNDGQFEYSPVG